MKGGAVLTELKLPEFSVLAKENLLSFLRTSSKMSRTIPFTVSEFRMISCLCRATFFLKNVVNGLFGIPAAAAAAFLVAFQGLKSKRGKKS